MYNVDELEVENQKIADYYECLVECDALNQNECRRYVGSFEINIHKEESLTLHSFFVYN